MDAETADSAEIQTDFILSKYKFKERILAEVSMNETTLSSPESGNWNFFNSAQMKPLADLKPAPVGDMSELIKKAQNTDMTEMMN